jgi:hypothetical protein
VEKVQRLKRAMAVLPDNAVALIADDEVEKYQVVRIADEIVVDLLKNACGVDYARASAKSEARRLMLTTMLDAASAGRRVGCGSWSRSTTPCDRLGSVRPQSS